MTHKSMPKRVISKCEVSTPSLRPLRQNLAPDHPLEQPFDRATTGLLGRRRWPDDAAQGAPDPTRNLDRGNTVAKLSIRRNS
jgi:hypothetical protein